MLCEIQCVKVVTQRREHAPMRRIFFRDFEAEGLGVEPPRLLFIGDAEVHMPDLRDANRHALALSCRLEVVIASIWGVTWTVTQASFGCHNSPPQPSPVTHTTSGVT